MSDGLTISDIHKIRQENYEQTKHLSNDELLKKTKKQATIGKQRVDALRKRLEASVGVVQ